MLCKVIATPCEGRGTFNGWTFSPDDGRLLNNGEIRFTYNPRMRNHYVRLLRQARKDYLKDIQDYYERYKASRQALEYTQTMRAMKRDRERFIRDGWELTHESL